MSTVDHLTELMNRKEDLHPELEAYMDGEVLGFPAIRHPLVYSVPHLSNAMANEQLRVKKEMVSKARRKRDWSHFIWLHERPYRLDAFQAICYHLGDRRYWDLLGSIWTDSENIWQNRELWVECLTAERRYRSHMMSAEERVALREDHGIEFTVYRGFSSEGTDGGLSWTTNSIVGKFFARRLAPEGASRYLATGTVRRRDVIAFFDGRSEQEIVVLPEHVRNVQITPVERNDDGA